jgi:hypothetical protein
VQVFANRATAVQQCLTRQFSGDIHGRVLAQGAKSASFQFGDGDQSQAVTVDNLLLMCARLDAVLRLGVNPGDPATGPCQHGQGFVLMRY